MSQYLYFYGKNKKSGEWNALTEHPRSTPLYAAAVDSGSVFYDELSFMDEAGLSAVREKLSARQEINKDAIARAKNQKKDFMNMVPYCNNDTIEHIIQEIRNCDETVEEMEEYNSEIEDAFAVLRIMENISANDLDIYWGIEAIPPASEYSCNE